MVISGTFDLVANPNWKQLQLQEIYIECDTSLSPVTINLFPIIDLDRFWNVKLYISDKSNNASTNPITINAGASGAPLIYDTINRQGITNFTIDYSGGDVVLTVIADSKWSAISQSILAQTGLTYMGTWNANTNTPTLTSGVGVSGNYYIVSVAGNTDLDGTIDWQVGDWAIFVTDTPDQWQKVDNHDVQAYNTIQNESISLPQRSILDFKGLGVEATDDGVKTTVTILEGLPATNYGLYAQTANSAPVAATIVEGSLIGAGVGTLSVPANGFFVGASFRADFGGLLSAKNNDTLRIRVKTSSGAILADSGVQTMTTSIDDVFQFSINFTIRATGVAGVASIVSLGVFHTTKQSNNQQAGFAFNTVNSTTFDTTILNTIEVTAQWSTNSALNSIYSDIFILNKIY